MPGDRSSHRRAHEDGGLRAVKLVPTFVLLLALVACAPRSPLAACDIVVTQDVALSAVGSHETIVTRAIGPSCDKAIGVYAIYDEEGQPAWAWATPLSRAFGDRFVSADDAAMREFLSRWAQPLVSKTQSAPPWETLTAGQTTLDRLTYDDIRARDLPMLCHASGTAREACLFWEPVAGGAGLYFERDVQETTE